MPCGSLGLTPFVVRGLCKFSGFDSLLGKGLRGQAAEGCVRSVFVVVAPPLFDPLAGIGHGQEPGGIQAFRPQGGVERLDEGIVGRLARPGEVDLHAVEIGPLVEHAAGELRAVVDPQALRPAALAGQSVERLDHLVGPEARSRNDRRAPLACGSPPRSGSGTGARRRAGRP